MSGQLMFASIAITMALILYTIGVFTERHRGALTGPILTLFWLGLICDSTGTAIMTSMARSNAGADAPAIHGITGALAIVLMLLHAGWATLVWLRSRKGGEKALEQQRTFHRFSTIVWLLWLVPYLIGLFVGMPMLHMGTVPSVIASVAVVAVLAVILLRPKRNR